MRILLLVITGLLASLAGNTHAHVAAESEAVAPGSHVIVVRHAEKTSDSARDPDLSVAGHARAERLAMLLAPRNIVATYASGYLRTQQTVAPTAAKHALAVTTYDASRDASEFAAQLRRDHPRGSILVAGHSNTVPAIVSALCQCPVPDMDDATYDRLYDVQFRPGQPPQLLTSRIP